jgi:hypothetical protein
MIHYALRCADGHEFDGWFKSSASFDAQAGSGLLDCPVCASTSVQRALMAPRLAPRGKTTVSARAALPGLPEPAVQRAVQPEAASPQHAPPVPMPDEMRAVLQRIRAEVEKSCEYVGPRFAAEVRRMEDPGEERRPVYGEATPEEAAALMEDGIAVARIPWVPRADS